MKRLLLSAMALSFSTTAHAQAQPGLPSTGHWQIVSNSSPLTGARTMAASTESSNQLANMLGYAARASLIIRCG